MKKLCRAAILAAFVCVLGVCPIMAQADETSTTSTTESSGSSKSSTYDKLQEALAEKKELESALAKAKSNVKSISSNKTKAKEKAKEIKNELSSLNSRMNALTAQMEDLKAQIAESDELEKQAQAEVDRQYAGMKKRIQYMYENSTNALAMVMLTDGTLVDRLNAAEYINKVNQYDRQKFDEYKAAKEAQAAIGEGLTTQHSEIESMWKDLQATADTVSKLLGEQNQIVAQLDSELANAQEVQKAYEAEVSAQNEILAQIQAQLAAENGESNLMSSAGFMWPCPAYKRVSSDYGVRSSPTAGASTNHKGVDLAANSGSDILAAQSGKVTTATFQKSAGNYLIINHGKNADGQTVCTVYMHCSSFCVSQGDEVAQGQVIAKVGSTGVSTGPHLHFGVTVGGSYVSPWNYISKP